MIWLLPEAVAQRCSVKNVVLEISQNSQENTSASVFFDEVAGLRPTNLLKRDSGMGVFLWILSNFLERLVYRTPLVGAPMLQR